MPTSHLLSTSLSSPSPPLWRPTPFAPISTLLSEQHPLSPQKTVMRGTPAQCRLRYVFLLMPSVPYIAAYSCASAPIAAPLCVRLCVRLVCLPLLSPFPRLSSTPPTLLLSFTTHAHTGGGSCPVCGVFHTQKGQRALSRGSLDKNNTPHMWHLPPPRHTPPLYAPPPGAKRKESACQHAFPSTPVQWQLH